MKKVFILILVFFCLSGWINVPDLLAMGSNKGEVSPKPQALNLSSGVTEPIKIIVPAGTSLKVQLNQSIRTSTHRSDQSFFATLKEPILLGAKELIPAGVPLIGVISRSVESGHFSGTALLELKLVRMIISNDTNYSIATEPFQKEGNAHFLRNIGLIGVGALLGVGVGTLLEEIPGALVGIVLGGGTGAVLAYVTGKEDLFLKAGTDLVFKMSRPLTISVPPSPDIPLK
ncbi:MAG: hypothetical protein WA974_06060 [Thermodesulfobacteriota bacterium]